MSSWGGGVSQSGPAQGVPPSLDRGYPHPALDGGGYPHPAFEREYPGQVLMGGTLTRSGLGGGTPTRSSHRGVPPSSLGWGWCPHPALDREVPWPGPDRGTLVRSRWRGTPAWGYPITPWMGGTLARSRWGAGTPGFPHQGVLDTPRSVCLLHSRRRTTMKTQVTMKEL